jgi:hypothetical protein
MGRFTSGLDGGNQAGGKKRKLLYRRAYRSKKWLKKLAEWTSARFAVVPASWPCTTLVETPHCDCVNALSQNC